MTCGLTEQDLDTPFVPCNSRSMRYLYPFILTAFSATNATATDNCVADAMIVFDGSGSMAEVGFNDISEPRIFEARRAIADVTPEIEKIRRIGLVIYGPGGVDECSGLDLRFPPIPNAAHFVIDAIETLDPEGSTPLTEAVEIAAEELDFLRNPATIVLVTDGKETCGGKPCTLAAQLKEEGVDTTVHVIGFKVRSDFFTWNNSDDDIAPESVSRCLADITGGTYNNAETLSKLTAALRVTLGWQLRFKS